VNSEKTILEEQLAQLVSRDRIHLLVMLLKTMHRTIAILHSGIATGERENGFELLGP